MHEQITALVQSVEQVIIGKRDAILQVTAALLCGGHVLLEDVPGVGKTQLASALAKSVGGTFHRIQLTPDVMPSDITGFSLVNQTTFELEYRAGAAMCNFLLADEINRASPKVQSSLLEIMEEQQVSIDGVTHALPRPFMVIATQNPVETYGTYHLPEAQMDRFFMRISMGYPNREAEYAILTRKEAQNPLGTIAEPALTLEMLTGLQEQVERVKVSSRIVEYVLDLVSATRDHSGVLLGVSPRGSIALLRAAKASAFLYGREFVLPDDVKAMVKPVLSHRLILSPQGKTEYGTPELLLKALVDSVAVPVE